MRTSHVAVLLASVAAAFALAGALAGDPPAPAKPAVAIGCADAARGATLWSRSNGGITALAGDAERVFGADASDRVSAWRATTGDLLWSSERFLNRGLSGGVAVGPVVVFGDREGFVHFLSAESGEPQLRLPTDGQPVIGTPVVSGQTLIVTTAAGGLFAFRPN